MSRLKVINLYAGPGTGKSTTAAGIFHKMKLAGHKVELVTEFAKDLVYSLRNECLKDQLYVFAKQQHRLRKLEDKVDWVVTDSPLLLSLVYNGEYRELPSIVMEVYNKYDNYNFFLVRDKAYAQYGRLQTEDEARKLDNEIAGILGAKDGVPFTTVLSDILATDKILKEIGIE